MKTQIVGVHVGNIPNQKKNFATMLFPNLFVDFMLPTMESLHKQFGKGSKLNNNNEAFKAPFRELM